MFFEYYFKFFSLFLLHFKSFFEQKVKGFFLLRIRTRLHKIHEKMYVRSSPVFVCFPIFERTLQTTSKFKVGLSEVWIISCCWYFLLEIEHRFLLNVCLISKMLAHFRITNEQSWCNKSLLKAFFSRAFAGTDDCGISFRKLEKSLNCAAW